MRTHATASTRQRHSHDMNDNNDNKNDNDGNDNNNGRLKGRGSSRCTIWRSIILRCWTETHTTTSARQTTATTTNIEKTNKTNSRDEDLFLKKYYKIVKLKNALFKQLIRESKIKAHLQNFLTCEFVIHGVRVRIRAGQMPTRTREKDHAHHATRWVILLVLLESRRRVAGCFCKDAASFFS